MPEKEVGMRDEKWETYAFSDFVDVNPSVKLTGGGAFSFVEMKDLNDGQRNVYPSAEREISGGARFQNGDTLFARITPCLENGKICQVRGLKNNVGFGSTEFLVFRGKEGVSENDFVFYLSRFEEVRRFAEQNMIGTSGRQRVGKEAFDSLALELPKLPTQRRIAAILTALDDKIELNRRMNETLEGIAQAVWGEWFGKMETSELAELGDVVEFNPRVSITQGEMVVYVEMKDLPQNGMCISGFVEKPFTSGSKFQLNDTLLARITPCLENGKTAFANFLKPNEKAFGSTEFIVMRAKGEVSPYFVYFIAREENFRQFAINSMVGSSGRQRVQTEVLSTFEIAKPDAADMTRFHKFAEPIFDIIHQNALQSRTLTALRDVLLPRLMRGELEI